RSMTAARFLGRYELGECIGTGGVAEVLRATASGARGFSKAVVVKRVRDHLRGNAEVVEAFVRVAKLARRLEHGNVVQVLDLGTDDEGLPYLVLEYVDGCSLFELIERLAAAHETVPLAIALHVAEQVGSALQYVHGLCDDAGTPLGLVHRDVTPKNILCSRDGVVKLTDFGIARATREGSDTLPGFVKGTPQWLSPEQAAGRPVDERTDVYSLGLVLRHMLTPDSDAELLAIVELATEPAVRDRLPTAGAFVARLQAWRVERGISGAADRLATLVRRTSGSAIAKRAVALDAALHVDAGRDATRQAMPPRGSSPRRWPIAVLGAGALATIAAGIAIATPPRSAPPAETPAPVRIEPTPPPLPARSAEPPPAIETPVVDTSTPAPPSKAKPIARAAKSGRLRVNLLPYARVIVDGKDLGGTPFDQPMAAGDHVIELYNPESRQRVKKSVRIAAGQPSSIETW
ncbi:MAG TPA: protein kinase, partial [Nannocystaceae bacterium]|nr:protein kinase [Nannocystaceae bacterium]